MARRDVRFAAARELDPGLLDANRYSCRALRHIGARPRSYHYLSCAIRPRDARRLDRLIALAQRLSSVFEIRVRSFDEDHGYTSAFI
jgi:hypothetical protein